MGFREIALARLRRYREEADRSLAAIRDAEAMARLLLGRLFAGLERASALAREAGFEVETERTSGVMVIKAIAGPEAEARLTLGLTRGAAAESDEDLMHEELSRHTLDPSGFSGRILGWSESAGEEPCQVFSVYRDGVWRTKGLFVAMARGRVDDAEDVLDGFCLRILGRLIDLAALTGGAGRSWSGEPCTVAGYLSGEPAPTRLRWPR